MIDHTQIAALADGTLDGNEAAAAQAAIAQNPAAKAEYESLLHLKKTLQDKLPSHDCPATLNVCRERIQELKRVRRTEAIVGKYSYAMAAAIFIAILSAGLLHRYGGRLTMDRNVLSRSLNASAVGGSSVATPDASGAEAWLMRELHNPATGLKLMRMDVLDYEGHTINRKIYNDGSTDYVVLELPGVSDCYGQEIDGYPGMKYTQVNGANAISWCEGSTGYVVAARVPLGTLLNLINSN